MGLVLILLFVVLVSPPAPGISVPQAPPPPCDVRALVAALRDLRSLVEWPGLSMPTTTLEMRTPAQQLRERADEVERREALLAKVDAVLAGCPSTE